MSCDVLSDAWISLSSFLWVLLSRSCSKVCSKTSSLLIQESPFIWQMLCNTQQLMITSDSLSILWSRQFRRHLHLAFKIPKSRSTATLAEDKNLLSFFCSWDKFKLLGNGFASQVFAAYVLSPIGRGLIFYPSITSVGSISKMLRLAWIYNAESLRMWASWVLPG